MKTTSNKCKTLGDEIIGDGDMSLAKIRKMWKKK
jgi:hypothetical protein